MYTMTISLMFLLKVTLLNKLYVVILQVGVVASRYLQLNPRWTEPRYLNLMNNLLCGVPMTFMRRIPENTYLQLTHQVCRSAH